jgi:hypothetical protein
MRLHSNAATMTGFHQIKSTSRPPDFCDNNHFHARRDTTYRHFPEIEAIARNSSAWLSCFYTILLAITFDVTRGAEASSPPLFFRFEQGGAIRTDPGQVRTCPEVLVHRAGQGGRQRRRLSARTGGHVP